MKKVNPDIFKAYDIRGIYPKDLDEEITYNIGCAYSEILKRENPNIKRLKVVVGRDMRLASPQIKESLTKGLTDQGLDVIDIGLSSTPTFYFAVAYYKYNGGIIVTASHNPPEWIGFKLVRTKAIPVSGEEGIYEIRDLVTKKEFSPLDKRGKIEIQKNIVQEEVKEYLKKADIKKIKPLKIVVDPANSMGALDIEELFKHLPCKLIKINFKLDGTFPSHEPDPFKEENLEQIKKEVIKNKADLGIATDGDGDRIFFIDSNGQTIEPAIIRGILSQIFLRDNPGATICYDIRPGRITLDMIKEAGGKPVVTRVGHSLIKEKAMETKAVFAGESSGHFFVNLGYGLFETPIIVTLKILEELSAQSKSSAEWVKKYRVYHHSGEINSEVEDKAGKIKEIAEKYKDAVNISYLDGVTIEYSDYWFNVRPSNTEPLLRLNLEAKTKELMEKKRDEVLKIIRS